MKCINTPIEGLLIIEPTVFIDDRGCFLETYNKKSLRKPLAKYLLYKTMKLNPPKGVLRGLHFQKPPYAQAKLVRCIEGKVLDVAVDIRDGSVTYGQHVIVELSGEKQKTSIHSSRFCSWFCST